MIKNYLKRFEINRLFDKTNNYLMQESESYSSNKEISFFVLKRMHACVKLSPNSIDFFFSHIYRIKTWRTRIFHTLLKNSIKSSILQNLLIKKGFITQIYTLPSTYSKNWNKVDVLFAEWDFIGIFFEKQKLVTHLLYDTDYLYKLHNEIEARNELANTINIPELIDFNLKNDAWYQDQLSVSKNGQRISQADFEIAQEQLILINEKTSKEVLLKDYLQELSSKATNFYNSTSEVFYRIGKLVNYISLSSDIEINKEKIWLGRCHGDFNKNQLLKKHDKVYIIDWAESEQNIVWHDIVYNYIYATEETHKIDWEKAAASIPLLYDHLDQKYSSRLSDDILIAIVLIEVALKQHAAFNNNKGYINIWSRLVDKFEQRMRKSKMFNSKTKNKNLTQFAKR